VAHAVAWAVAEGGAGAETTTGREAGASREAEGTATGTSRDTRPVLAALAEQCRRALISRRGGVTAAAIAASRTVAEAGLPAPTTAGPRVALLAGLPAVATFAPLPGRVGAATVVISVPLPNRARPASAPLQVVIGSAVRRTARVVAGPHAGSMRRANAHSATTAVSSMPTPPAARDNARPLRGAAQGDRRIPCSVCPVHDKFQQQIGPLFATRHAPSLRQIVHFFCWIQVPKETCW